MKDSRIKVLGSETLLKATVFDVSRYRIAEADIEYNREIVEHPGSSVVLPMHSNGEITLVRQFRLPANEFLLEIPAGTVEKGETPEQCAFREIEEETGYRAGRLTKASEFFVSPGFLTEKMHLFLAHDLEKTEQKPDFDENIEVVRLKLDVAVALVGDGTIIDAKTIIGILLASRS